jgi:hypothetical protein
MAMNLASFDVLDSFISPVTGHVLCDFNYILIGNSQGIAVPTNGVPIGSLPNLTFNKTWVGNVSNRPIERPYIGDSTFVIRLANANLPSAQALEPLGLGLLKVITDGYLAIAISNTDYATTAYLTLLAAQIEASRSAIEAAKNASVISAAAATAASIAATGSSLAAENSWHGVEQYITQLYNTGLNQLPVEGDVNIQNFRVTNLKQSPEGDFDAVSFTFLWDLMRGQVDILWP